MDQNTVTIIGMIAAFLSASVTAFLAEPIKIYFQNRATLTNLKIALYKELLHDYMFLSSFEVDSNKVSQELSARAIEVFIRTECYNQAIQNELTFFYQLYEASTIHLLHARLAVITDSLKQKDTDYLKWRCIETAAAFAMYFHVGDLDKTLAKRLMSPDDYQELIRRGKEEFKKATNTMK